MRRACAGYQEAGHAVGVYGNTYERIVDMVLNHQSRMSAGQQTLMHWY